MNLPWLDTTIIKNYIQLNGPFLKANTPVIKNHQKPYPTKWVWKIGYQPKPVFETGRVGVSPWLGSPTA